MTKAEQMTGSRSVRAIQWVRPQVSLVQCPVSGSDQNLNRPEEEYKNYVTSPKNLLSSQIFADQGLSELDMTGCSFSHWISALWI